VVKKKSVCASENVISGGNSVVDTDFRHAPAKLGSTSRFQIIVVLVEHRCEY